MSDGEWLQWLDENVDKDLIVKYMIVHDFLAVRDTQLTNYCIYYNGKFFILPWDNDCSMSLTTCLQIGGDTPLTKRLMTDPYIRSEYNSWMQAYFLDTGDNNLLSDIQNELDRIYTEIDRAVFHDPTYYYTYDAFLEKKESLLKFIQTRGSKLPHPPLP
jgi:spore coat protein CotH